MKNTLKNDFLSSRVRYIPLEHIVPNPHQPRRDFDPAALAELADSIRQYGVLQPATVRTRGRDYELVAGERRFRAAKLAGLKELPCLIAQVGEEDSALLALMENLQRRDLNYMEEAAAIAHLVQRWGLSQEEAARKLRYDFLRQEAEKLGQHIKIYTAHHADDNAETILFNLIRGTGVAGLTGMAYQQNGICRPLLDVTREELAAYAAARHIPHVEDTTNADPGAAARNFLRLEVMPRLRQINPRAVEHINDAGRRLRVADQSLEEEAARRTAHVEVQEGRVTLSRQALAEATDAVRPRMLLRLFDLLGVGRRDITAAHLQDILHLTRDTLWGRESRVDLPQGVTARYCREWLILETRPQLLTEVQLLQECPVAWGDYRITLLDHREGEGLALRPWRQGERMGLTVGPAAPGDRLVLPETHGGGRSIKRLCMDRRISLSERDRLPAVYAGGCLAAVWRLGVDMAFAAPEGEPCRFIQITEAAKERDLI